MSLLKNKKKGKATPPNKQISTMEISLGGNTMSDFTDSERHEFEL